MEYMMPAACIVRLALLWALALAQAKGLLQVCNSRRQVIVHSSRRGGRTSVRRGLPVIGECLAVVPRWPRRQPSLLPKEDHLIAISGCTDEQVLCCATPYTVTNVRGRIKWQYHEHVALESQSNVHMYVQGSSGKLPV